MAFEKITRLTGAFKYGVGDGPLGMDTATMQPIQLVQIAFADAETGELIEVNMGTESAIDLGEKLIQQARSKSVASELLIPGNGAKL